MPQLVPSAPHFPPGHHGERAVWEALRDQLPPDALLITGQHLIEGSREAEIDLLVAWPDVGVAVIEVKGGQVWKDAEGWHQSGGGGQRRIGDPVEQAQDARHILQRHLHDLGPSYAAAARARTVHLVALPFSAVPASWRAPNAARAMFIDRNDLPHAAGRIREAIDAHGQGHHPLTVEQRDRLRDALAAEMPRQVDVLAAAEQRAAGDQLTQDQARLLDHVGRWPRLRVIGGAGTGKTFLAMHQARRLTRDGKRVALVCYSRGLARYFERLTATWPRREQPAYVGLFHDLPRRWGAEPGDDNDSDYWERRLPLQLGELAREQAPTELFDAIVVDEAQDFSDRWWPSLLACLRDEEHGGLYVFLDDAQRVFPRDGRAPIELPPFELVENLRNTKQIAQLISSLSNVRMTPRGLPGAPVRVVDVPADEAITAADDAVEALLDEGWDPGQVALLTTHRRHPEQRNAVDYGGYQQYWDAFFAEEDVFYGHVLGFKGLERPALVLCVNGDGEVDRARERFYAGLSRPARCSSSSARETSSSRPAGTACATG